VNWPSINSGEFRSRGELRSPTYNEAGDQIEDWTLKATVWAKRDAGSKLLPGDRQEKVASAREVSVHDELISIRYRSDVTPVWQIWFGDEHFEIRDVQNVGSLGVRLDMTCRLAK
jgi:SPP1 family predicted phage head-tail adaptor